MLSKRIAFVLGLALSMITFVGCGKNPHIIDTITSGEIGGNDPIDPSPTPDPRDPEPTPTPPPSARIITLGARDYDAKELESAVIELPYQTKKVKTIGYGRSQNDLLCRFSSNDQCVHDRQVLFAFDLPSVGSIRKIHDVRIQANFITYGLSFDSELICLNNLATCSGNGIKKIPLLGLSKYVKKKWWNQTYWAAGYEDVVKNDYFQKQIAKSKRINKLTRISGFKDFSLRDLFDLSDADLLSLVTQEETLWFTVADDTFVMAPTLVVVYE